MLRFSTGLYINLLLISTFKPSDLYDIAPQCLLSFLVKVDFRMIKCIKDVNEKLLSLQLIISSFSD